jgi:hypothetical protein
MLLALHGITARLPGRESRIRSSKLRLAILKREGAPQSAIEMEEEILKERMK